MEYLLFIYAASVIFMAFTITRIYYNEEENRKLLFTLLSTYILNLVLPIFFFYFNNLWLSTINSIILALFSLYLYIEIKKATKSFKLLALPYVLITFFIASAITTTLILS